MRPSPRRHRIRLGAEVRRRVHQHVAGRLAEQARQLLRLACENLGFIDMPWALLLRGWRVGVGGCRARRCERRPAHRGARAPRRRGCAHAVEPRGQRLRQPGLSMHLLWFNGNGLLM
jgi:hypothetical protein